MILRKGILFALLYYYFNGYYKVFETSGSTSIVTVQESNGRFVLSTLMRFALMSVLLTSFDTSIGCVCIDFKAEIILIGPLTVTTEGLMVTDFIPKFGGGAFSIIGMIGRVANTVSEDKFMVTTTLDGLR